MQLSARPLRRVMACIGRGGARLARNENGAFDWLVSGTEWQAGADVLANGGRERTLPPRRILLMSVCGMRKLCGSVGVYRYKYTAEKRREERRAAEKATQKGERGRTGNPAGCTGQLGPCPHTSSIIAGLSTGERAVRSRLPAPHNTLSYPCTASASNRRTVRKGGIWFASLHQLPTTVMFKIPKS
eukprot:1194888-Prorocentrum_minimum.AAC.3